VSQAATRLALRLAEEWNAGRLTSVTWLNHYSALKVLAADDSLLAGFDYVGIDGLLLLHLIGSDTGERTSADLVVPRVLPLLSGARVALIGGRREKVDRAADIVSYRFLADSATVVDVRDGYSQVPDEEAIAPWLESCRPDVVLVGLGAVLQERWARTLQDRMPAGLIMACGGFFDQVARDTPYYPSWAYPLRLNWAVRLAREPGRLWSRYTVGAVQAIAARHNLRNGIISLAGFAAHRGAVAAAP
jgi:exopolysaccharide biosynthesis WecB/TagA/CpsF family protein